MRRPPQGPSLSHPLTFARTGYGICVIVLGVWIYIIKENRRRDQKLETLSPDHIHPEGPLDDRDIRFRFTVRLLIL